MEQDLQLEVILPDELKSVVLQSGIDKAEQHAATFAPFMIAVKEFSNKAGSLNKDAPSTLDAQIARQIRLAMVKNRTAADQAKDSGKASLIAESNLIQSLFNVVVSTSKMVEADLTAIEKHAELKEAARQNALRQDRLLALAPYLANPEIYPLGTMSDDAFENLLTGSRLALEQKNAEAALAELERIRIENERALEAERLRVENDRLRKEAEERQQVQSYRLATLRPLMLPSDNSDLSLLWSLSEEEFANVFDIQSAKRVQHEAAMQAEKEEKERQQAIKDAELEQERIAREAKLAEIEESNRLAREKAAALQAEKDEAERVRQEEVNKKGARYEKRQVALEGIGVEFDPFSDTFSSPYISVEPILVRDLDDAAFDTQLGGWAHHVAEAKKAAQREADRKAAEVEAAKAPDKDKLRAWVNALSMPVLPVTTIEASHVASAIDNKFNSFKTWALAEIEAL